MIIVIKRDNDHINLNSSPDKIQKYVTKSKHTFIRTYHMYYIITLKFNPDPFSRYT